MSKAVAPVIVDWKSTHPLLRFASFDNVQISESIAVKTPIFPFQGNPGWNLTTAMADDAIRYMRELKEVAPDKPFHHYPPVTALTDQDKQQLAAMVQSRVDAFKPDFGAFLKLVLETKPDARVADIRKAKCLDKAYAAGVRMTAPAADQLEFVTTGQPEVVVGRKGGDLFSADRKAFEKIKGDDAQMCAGMVLGMVYPPRLIAVRGPDGTWSIPY